ncbi:VOC family protein [Paraburkholderia sediminicola]|uniref:VOC family protein n=1 Tax=Paraburkholderia sediminicola TaxID=458836 RepID=UPI0038B9A462
MTIATDIAYLAFNYEDVGRAENFYKDFGLVTSERTSEATYMRGADGQRYCFIARKGGRPGLACVGMRASNMDALRTAATLPGASAVETLQRPGGGYGVRMASPDGIPFELVYGIETVEPLPPLEPLKVNHGQHRPRKGVWQRPGLEHARALRLGHCALTTNNYAANAAWLESHFGMRPSDVLYDGSKDNALGGFFHCTGGEEWTDHHTIALFPGEPGPHHTSFEVQDFDSQFIANRYLTSRGWQPLWGVGRHVLGSQVFDYWFDPEGNVAEHFTDGDLVPPELQPEFHQVSDDSLAQWGPPMQVIDFIRRKGVST